MDAPAPQAETGICRLIGDGANGSNCTFNNLRAKTARFPLEIMSGNQKESRSDSKQKAFSSFLLWLRYGAQLRKSLISFVRGSAAVLHGVDFRLKNLIFCRTFQAPPPHICDLGFGPSLSNGC
jgi:hypothetical protein